jgi:hypothetical protein
VGVKRLVDYDNPRSLGSVLRARRMRVVEGLVEKAFSQMGRCRILDVGGTREYWRGLRPEIWERCGVEVTLVNMDSRIEDAGASESLGRFKAVVGDGCDLHRWADGEFEISHSNSTIEHVGEWGRMREFASELQRVGRSVYCQVPNFWFPMEPHFLTPFFHWLPEVVRVELLLRYSLGHYPRAANVHEAIDAVRSARLPSRKLMSALFPGCEIRSERVFGFAKSILAIREWQG